MSYAAKHYVRLAGRMYTPGEVIDIPIPEEQRERLLRLNAIVQIAEPDTGQGEAARDAYTEPPASAPDETDIAEDAEEEAPEIDVMDGIIPPAEAAAAAEKKPTTKGRRKA
jgi:hypothetical protein